MIETLIEAIGNSLSRLTKVSISAASKTQQRVMWKAVGEPSKEMTVTADLATVVQRLAAIGISSEAQ
jgi:hypothetical protein